MIFDFDYQVDSVRG